MGMVLLIYTMAQHVMVANNRVGRSRNLKLTANSITLLVQQRMASRQLAGPGTIPRCETSTCLLGCK